MNRGSSVLALAASSTLAACAPESGAPSLAITIADAPNSTIACVVSWTTEEPAASAVEFGETARYELRRNDPTLVTEHRVTVLGMHAETAYHLRAVSEAAGGKVLLSEDATYTTGALPKTVVPGVVTVTDPAASPGWTLAPLSYLGLPTAAIMYDAAGKPVWYQVSDEGKAIGETQLLDGGAGVLFFVGNGVPAVELDLPGHVTWEGPAQPMGGPDAHIDGQFHHEFAKLSNGNYGTIRRSVVDSAYGEVIVEMAPTHDEVWTWDAFDHLPNPQPGDWLHGNAARFDLEENTVTFSARTLNAVFKIDRETGGVLWRLGEGGDFSPDPTASEPWFQAQHDPESLPGGHLLVYDNGTSQRGYSRVVEYALDTVSMQATIVWEYPGSVSDLWYSDALGSAQRLPNGNTLITASHIEGKPSRIFEVTPEKAIVWEMLVPPLGLTPSAVYRSAHIEALAERIQP